MIVSLQVRDERIKVSNEVLSGMKVIKVQAWENEYKVEVAGGKCSCRVLCLELVSSLVYLFVL